MAMAMTNGMNYNTPGFNPYTQNFYPTYLQTQPDSTTQFQSFEDEMRDPLDHLESLIIR